MSLRCAVGLACLGVTLVDASERVTVVKPALHCSWHIAEGEPVPNEGAVTLLLALKPASTDALIRTATRVSDPQSPSYGQYLTRAEISALSAPAPEARQAVETWLHDHGAATRALSQGAVLEANFSVSSLEAAFRTRMLHHVNDVTRQRVVRAGDYSLPAGISSLVEAVHGLHGLPLPPRGGVGRTDPDVVPVNVTPAVIAAVYGVAGVVGSGSTANRQAVAEFQRWEGVNQSDVDDFFALFVHNASHEEAQVHAWVGDEGQGYSLLAEATLDVEYIMGPAPGILTDFWYWKEDDFCLDVMQWSVAVLDAENPPLVHSMSYGWQGNLSDIGCSEASISSIETNLAKLAARGITVVVSSGDAGSGYTMPCNDEALSVNVSVVGPVVGVLSNSHAHNCCKACSGAAWTWAPPHNCTFYASVEGHVPLAGAVSGGLTETPPQVLPSWPASSQWVTAVGGTKFIDQDISKGEKAVDTFGSGGGFSPLFSAPSYQNASVAAYLAGASRLPPAESFAAGGRATPDVAALGEHFLIQQWGYPGAAGGTSASAPVFAALVSLLNEARLAKALPPMGFLNPFLYQNPEAFTDVVQGHNAISRSGTGFPFGFNCSVGWDPVTGLGTPLFPKLLQAAMSAAPGTLYV